MSDEERGEERQSGPWLRHALLWGAFAILVAVGVVTVMLPSLEDAPQDEQAPQERVENDTPSSAASTSP